MLILQKKIEKLRRCFCDALIMEIVGDLEQFLADTWHDIANLVRESAVYIDHAAAECLHWNTGGKIYSFLKDAGAVSVYELAMYNFRVRENTIFLSHTWIVSLL